SSTSIASATRPRQRFRSRSTTRSVRAGSRRDSSCCSRPWAPASRSAQYCCAGVFEAAFLARASTMSRVFILSPANCGGRRARQAVSPNATFALAAALRSGEGAPLGDFFSFISGLDFRGTLTYARRFARPSGLDNPSGGAGMHSITPTAGLRTPDTLVTHAAVRAFARGDIDAANRKYRAPLESSARALAEEAGPDCEVVLLGSVASPKYVSILTGIFGERLLFPVDFVGRGDMSRGGLMLRRAREGVELSYAPVLGATLHGARPPKLPKLRYGKAEGFLTS